MFERSIVTTLVDRPGSECCFVRSGALARSRPRGGLVVEDAQGLTAIEVKSGRERDGDRRGLDAFATRHASARVRLVGSPFLTGDIRRVAGWTFAVHR